MTEYTQIAIVVPDSLHGFDLEMLVQHHIDNLDMENIVDIMNFITDGNDIFMSSYIGYWAYGLKHYPDVGWLVFDEADAGEDAQAGMIEALIEVHEDFEPHKYEDCVHLFDKKFAFQVALNVSNLADWDANDIDNAIQKTLFGDIVYG